MGKCLALVCSYLEVECSLYILYIILYKTAGGYSQSVTT